MKRRSPDRLDKAHAGKRSLLRALSKMGIASRKVALDLIRTGQIKIAGRRILDPELKVDVPVRGLLVNDRPVGEIRKVYYMMHKPKGVITTRSDERGRKTIYDLLSPEIPWVFPVGRLDKESSGLLLLTNDTAWGERILGPDSKIPKTYHVKIDREIGDEEIAEMRSGLKLSDDLGYLPVKVEKIRVNPKTCWLEMTLVEGKNRQIRRMLEHLGYRVENLVRIKIGRLDLGTLNPGEIKAISETGID